MVGQLLGLCDYAAIAVAGQRHHRNLPAMTWAWPLKLPSGLYRGPAGCRTRCTDRRDALGPWPNEATRDGAPPIDLIDGNRLCELLKRYDLGVRTATRTVEDITIDTMFFGEI
jgi:hypothetical protein